jgi:hypothetical protein
MHMAVALSLPPIALDSLPERTKDYILGICNGSDLTPEQAVRRVLNQAARPFLLPSATTTTTTTTGATATATEGGLEG